MPLSALASNECPSKNEVNASRSATSIPDGPDDTSIAGGPPTGPEPGDIIQATWTNVPGHTVFRPAVTWFVNNSVHTTHVEVEGSTSDDFDTTGLNTGDEIEAWVSYRTGVDEVVGTTLSSSDELPTNDEINSNIVMLMNLPAGSEIPSKQEILDNAKLQGSPGALSNSLVLQ